MAPRMNRGIKKKKKKKNDDYNKMGEKEVEKVGYMVKKYRVQRARQLVENWAREYRVRDSWDFV